MSKGLTEEEYERVKEINEQNMVKAFAEMHFFTIVVPKHRKEYNATIGFMILLSLIIYLLKAKAYEKD